MTGISRKEVSKIRKPPDDTRWTPSMETSPVNTILHEWHFDADFSDGAGKANPLPFEGPVSFSTLVARYVGDIPPGAMRATLQKAGVLAQDAEGRLVVSQPFFYSHSFDEDFIRGLAFSLSNLASTLAYNSALHQRTDITRERKHELSRLERGVWSEHLGKEAVEKFKLWVDANVPRFLEEANLLIGQSELPESEWSSLPPRAVGIGIYYYEED
jgi:hypothetical protein